MFIVEWNDEKGGGMQFTIIKVVFVQNWETSECIEAYKNLKEAKERGGEICLVYTYICVKYKHI